MTLRIITWAHPNQKTGSFLGLVRDLFCSSPFIWIGIRKQIGPNYVGLLPLWRCL